MKKNPQKWPKITDEAKWDAGGAKRDALGLKGQKMIKIRGLGKMGRFLAIFEFDVKYL